MLGRQLMFDTPKCDRWYISWCFVYVTTYYEQTDLTAIEKVTYDN